MKRQLNNFRIALCRPNLTYLSPSNGGDADGGIIRTVPTSPAPLWRARPPAPRSTVRLCRSPTAAAAATASDGGEALPTAAAAQHGEQRDRIGGRPREIVR